MAFSPSAFYGSSAVCERRRAADAALLAQIDQIAGEQPALG